MRVITENLNLSTKGNTDVLDITAEVQDCLVKTKLKNGIVNITVHGSTGGLTTCEFEPGLVQDLKAIYNKFIPPGPYHHDEAWHDGNGHSHLRATLTGPSLTISFANGELLLGTWQQIIFLDFDNRSRERKIILQFLGE